MSRILLLTGADHAASGVLPALNLLAHEVRVSRPDLAAIVDSGPVDAVLVDGRRDLPAARTLCRLLVDAGPDAAVIVVCTEGGLAGVAPDWRVDDVLLADAGPAEVEARLRLAVGRRALSAQPLAESGVVRAGDVLVDETTYSARLRGRVLDLTFKEFELLKFLAQHPGRVFSRAQLLQEVWGYDYFGGTRTVDVHVRRLRAKLGPDHEALIGTVRNVGYKFVARPESDPEREPASVAAAAAASSTPSAPAASSTPSAPTRA